MPVPILLQRVLVWGHTRFQSTIDVDGIALAEHPDFDTNVLKESLAAALARIARIDQSQENAVHRHIRIVLITAKFKNILAPYGAAFLPGNSPEWRDPRKLAGWLVWVAAYVAASKEFRLTRGNAADAAARAKDVRQEFYHAHDLVYQGE